MATQNFDELNRLKRRSIPYEEYFRDMQLTDKQKKERLRMALFFEEVLGVIFLLMRNEAVSPVTVKQEFVYEVYDFLVTEEVFETEEELNTFVGNLADEIVDATIDNMTISPNDYDYLGETPYWVSNDRAMFIAENEANTVMNTKEFTEAKRSGKTHKIWMAYPDNRVRPTHIQTNGAKVPIDSYFDVGLARMLYPKDVTSELSTGAEHPEEVVNCRCSVRFV